MAIMELAAAAILAGIIGATLAGLEIATGEFRETFVFVRNGRSYRRYVGLYGALTAIAFVLFRQLVPETDNAGVVSLGSPWVQAIIVGLTGKSLFQISIFSNSRATIGLELITRLFEPGLVNQMRIEEWVGMKSLVESRLPRYTDLEDAKRRANEAIPPSFHSEKEREAFFDTIDDAPDVKTVMLRLIKFAGVDVFEAAFP